MTDPGRALRHTIAWGAVALLHLLLWVVLTQRPLQTMRPQVLQRVTLRLLPELARAESPRPAPPAVPVPLMPRLPPLPRVSPLPRVTADIPAAQPRPVAPPRTADPEPATQAPGPQPITVPVEPPQAAASQSPLDLLWRRPAHRATESARNAALADPRANTARATPAERTARTLGSDTRLTEEARADGTVRVRQGSTCVDLKTARASQLFPFEAGAQRAPRFVESCD